MATAQQFINKAASHIGISGTDNKFNTWYWGFRCYDANSYPWCATFMSYVANEIGLKFNKSASAAAFANQFKRVNDADVIPGDIVVYNWDGRNNIGWCDHVGVVEWFNHSSQLFGTIEGNTGNVAGGTVMRQTRNNNSSYFTAFFRPNYSSNDSNSKPQSSPVSTSKPKEPAKKNGQPIYNAMVNGRWLDAMQGKIDSGGSSDDYAGQMGIGIQFLGIEGVGKYRVCSQSNGWLPYVSKRNLNDLDNGCAGDGSAIIAVEIPNSSIKYQVHTRGGGWLDWMIGTKDTGGSSDTFAGEMLPIDAIRIVKI